MSNLEFAGLGSGSKGNATVIRCGTECVLVDCGFSATEIEKRLARIELSPSDICAVLLTHEHSDHSNGVASACRRFNLPLYSSWGTIACLRERGANLTDIEIVTISGGQHYNFGALKASPVLVPHDAREPLQFVFTNGHSKLGILTDLGSVTSHVLDSYKQCDALLLEFNHDEQMLREGSYPAKLKARVAGDWGHLSNKQAGQLLAAVDHCDLQHLVIAHISEKNNELTRVQSILDATLVNATQTIFAEQARGFDWLTLGSMEVATI
ncbi:MAG: MBL fold metallo-hydrolase [Pseudomonadales bacterium]